MFNLVQLNKFKTGRVSIPIDRLYGEEVPDNLTPEFFDQLTKIPSIVMEEGAPITDGDAHFANLKDFKISRKSLSFTLSLIQSERTLDASIFEECKEAFGLSDAYRWNHTCIQVSSADIYEHLYLMSHSHQMNSPSVFAFNNPPKIIGTQVACMMPFHPSFDDTYETIKQTCEDLNLDCKRVDEIYSNGPIINDVVQCIDEARIVICDLTGKNANVLYETGIAHAIGREVIIIAQDIARDVPFDLRHLRCISYSGINQAGRKALQERLTQTLENVLAVE